MDSDVRQVEARYSQALQRFAGSDRPPQSFKESAGAQGAGEEDVQRTKSLIEEYLAKFHSAVPAQAPTGQEQRGQSPNPLFREVPHLQQYLQQPQKQRLMTLNPFSSPSGMANSINNSNGNDCSSRGGDALGECSKQPDCVTTHSAIPNKDSYTIPHSSEGGCLLNDASGNSGQNNLSGNWGGRTGAGDCLH